MSIINNKTRLIFFLPNFSFGGAGNSIFKLCKFLSNKNFSILVISLGKNFYKKKFVKYRCEIIELNHSRLLFAISKWPLLLIGRNSVNPCIIPRIIDSTKLISLRFFHYSEEFYY